MSRFRVWQVFEKPAARLASQSSPDHQGQPQCRQGILGQKVHTPAPGSRFLASAAAAGAGGSYIVSLPTAASVPASVVSAPVAADCELLEGSCTRAAGGGLAEGTSSSARASASRASVAALTLTSFMLWNTCVTTATPIGATRPVNCLLSPCRDME